MRRIFYLVVSALAFLLATDAWIRRNQWQLVVFGITTVWAILDALVEDRRLRMVKARLKRG